MRTAGIRALGGFLKEVFVGDQVPNIPQGLTCSCTGKVKISVSCNSFSRASLLIGTLKYSERYFDEDECCPSVPYFWSSVTYTLLNYAITAASTKNNRVYTITYLLTKRKLTDLMWRVCHVFWIHVCFHSLTSRAICFERKKLTSLEKKLLLSSMQTSRISLQQKGLQQFYISLFVNHFCFCDIKGYLCVYHKT